MDRIGPYVIEDELGGGAMGTVYRARHQELGAQYALKVLKPQLFHEIDELRFRREMEAMAAVSDVPGVVRIHTAGFDAGQPYYVMDLVAGEDLSTILRRTGRLELERAVRYGLALARTLSELHARGLIHRDIKPANVIIDEHDQPRLADFGLSKAFADESNRLTATGEAIGTPLYMAPEQARGEPVGPPSDVYALAMLLFVTVAGVPAVSGQTSVEVLINANAGSHERLRGVAPAAPLALDELCHACFKADPSKRPSAEEVAAILEQFLHELEAGEAEPEQRLSLAATAALLGVLLVALGVLAVVVRGTFVARSTTAEATDAVREARDWLPTALAQLAPLGAPDAALVEVWTTHREAVRARVASSPDGETAALLVRLELLGGELALRQGDAATAQASLAAALAVPGAGRAVGKAKHEAVVLRAGLAIQAKDPEGKGLALIGQAEAVWKGLGLPARTDLTVGRIRLQLQRGRVDAALKATQAAGADRLPAALSCEVFLRAGKLTEASRLLAQVSEARLRARVRLAEAEVALREGDAVSALARVRDGKVALHPDLTARLGKALGAARSRIYRWEHGPPQGRFIGMWREVSFHELKVILDPRYRMPDDRCHLVVGHALNAVSLSEHEPLLQFLAGFLRLRPDNLNSYDLFGRSLQHNLTELLKPHPERLAVLEQGRKFARRHVDAARARGEFQIAEAAENTYIDLTRWLGIGLCFLRESAKLRALVEETHRSAVTDDLKGYLSNLLGTCLLTQKGSAAEAEQRLREARRLAPDSLYVVYTHFYVQYERKEIAGALVTARRMAGLKQGKHVPRHDVNRLAMVLSWLSFQEEEAGNLVAAAKAAYGVCRRYGWLPNWPIRYAQLFLRTQPPPARQHVEAAVEGVLVPFRASRRGASPVRLRALAREDRRAELAKALDELAARHKARTILTHPADF